MDTCAGLGRKLPQSRRELRTILETLQSEVILIIGEALREIL